MQWFGIGVTLAVTFALGATVLHLLVGWPGPLGAVVAAGTVLVPLGLLASESRRLAPHGSRGLVQVLAVLGFVVVVSAIYLVLVLGLGHAPKTTGDKEVLALSMVASGIAALIFVPVRERFLQSSTRFVYGAREAPDEVLRTFGSRLTRAIPMDELLLQLAESLRKTMALTSAEVFTGAGEVLERTASVPDLGAGFDRRLTAGAAGGHPCRGVGNGVGVDLVARACWPAARRSRSASLRSATPESCSG